MYNPNVENTGHDRPTKKREKKRTDPQVRAKAEELAASGMPFQLAMAVALGRVDLNTALERMARDQKVDRMMAKYDLGRALATQVVLKQADLEFILAQRRMAAHREENRTRSCLDELLISSDPMVFGLHGQRLVHAQVVDVKPYTATLRLVDSGEEEEIHKLQFKYAYRSTDEKRMNKTLRWDEALKAEPKEPIVRPQDRYSISDKRLFQLLDNQESIGLTLLEGENLRCKLEWFGRFELAVVLKDGETRAQVFRHALHRVQSA